MKEQYIYTLISKYLENKCTQDEITFIIDWCNRSEKNKKEFVQLKKIWILSNKKDDKNISLSAPDVWNSIVSGISERMPKTYSKRTLIYYTSISAVVAIFLMLCINTFTNHGDGNKETKYTHFYMPRGEKGQLFLPDGTKIWLNSDSKLTISNNFNTTDRIVTLEGEAFFDVVKNEKLKFIVQTESVDVKVHGTAFNVASYSYSDDINVSLQRGSVSVYKKESDEELTSLIPNQYATINKKSLVSKVDTFDGDTNFAWTFEELIFELAPLNEVFDKMESWYGVNITVVSPKDNLKYRFKIKSESLIEILELINKMTPIEYKIDGKEVIVKYK